VRAVVQQLHLRHTRVCMHGHGCTMSARVRMHVRGRAFNRNCATTALEGQTQTVSQAQMLTYAASYLLPTHMQRDF
jgi:hypothetical protein